MIYTQQDYDNLVELLLFYDLEDTTQEIDKILYNSNYKHLKTHILNALKKIDDKIDFYLELKNSKLFSMSKNSLEYKEILANDFAHNILVSDEWKLN